MGKLTIIALFSLGMGLSSCVISVDGDSDGEYSHHSDWQDREHKNRKHISRLEQSLAYSDILNRMGVADFSELYEHENDTFRVLYYRTQRIDGDGVTTKDECTPLVFKNGLLIGWGETAFRNISH